MKTDIKKFRSYLFGFVFSLTLTVCAFAIVSFHLASAHEFPSHEVCVLVLCIAALLQLVVQLTFFLHMADEPRPRWNLLALSFAVLVVTILMGGTMWIMSNLMHMQHITQPNVFEEENIFPTADDHGAN